MNFLDAAYEILAQAKQPLHYTDITSRAQAAGILEFKGRTPEATMGSRLYTDTKQPASRFKRVSRGMFLALPGRRRRVAGHSGVAGVNGVRRI